MALFVDMMSQDIFTCIADGLSYFSIPFTLGYRCKSFVSFRHGCGIRGAREAAGIQLKSDGHPSRRLRFGRWVDVLSLEVVPWKPAFRILSHLGGMFLHFRQVTERIDLV